MLIGGLPLAFLWFTIQGLFALTYEWIAVYTAVVGFAVTLFALTAKKLAEPLSPPPVPPPGSDWPRIYTGEERRRAHRHPDQNHPS